MDYSKYFSWSFSNQARQYSQGRALHKKSVSDQRRYRTGSDSDRMQPLNFIKSINRLTLASPRYRSGFCNGSMLHLGILFVQTFRAANSPIITNQLWPNSSHAQRSQKSKRNVQRKLPSLRIVNKAVGYLGVLNTIGNQPTTDINYDRHCALSGASSSRGTSTG